MSGTAVAAVLTKPETFDIREMPIPDIGPDDGILRIEAGGLCGTDVEQFHGHLSGTGRDVMPIIPGHELMGHVEAVGAEAAQRWGVKEGDRVALEAGVPCGQCRNCLNGAFKRCKRKLGYGLYRGTDYQHGLWGGYASHAYLHPQAVMHKLPDDVELDSGLTSRAINSANDEGKGERRQAIAQRLATALSKNLVSEI